MNALAPLDAAAPTVIDVDTHLTEPHDLWTSRAPAKWRDRVPQIRMVDGAPHWVLDGEVLSTTKASSVIKPDLSKGQGFEAVQYKFDEVHPASYDVRERLKVMDQQGIQAQILYPNLVGFGGGRIFRADSALKTVVAQIYNDALAEFMEASNQRIFGMAVLPWWDIDAAVAEAKRCAAMGLRGVNINPEPQYQGLPDLGDPHWTPLFAICEELGLPINFHIGASEDQVSWIGSRFWGSQSSDQQMTVGVSTLFFSNANIIANVIISGVPERFPNLKFVSVESGVGWIPFLLEALDYYGSDVSPSVLKGLSLKPSEYFKRQFYACFWFEKDNLAEAVKILGEDNLMFETDFPHSTCYYPNPVERVTESLREFEPALRNKLLAGNAARLYRIPV